MLNQTNNQIVANLPETLSNRQGGSRQTCLRVLDDQTSFKIMFASSRADVASEKMNINKSVNGERDEVI